MHRSNTWWDNIVLNSFTDQDWLNNFRISRQTFLYLCDKLSSRLQRQDTVMRCCISVQKRVAITLWCLAIPAEYRTVGHIFGVSRTSPPLEIAAVPESSNATSLFGYPLLWLLFTTI